MFETTEWSLETRDGKKIDLLDGADPFQGIEMDAEEVKVVGGVLMLRIFRVDRFNVEVLEKP